MWSIRRGLTLDTEMDDAEVVDLLLELSSDDTTEEQMAALVHILGHDKPWDVLNMQRTASEEEASASIKAASMLVHPDTCKHPRGVEAFQKLTEAYNWARDRKEWGTRQLAREQLEVQTQLWNRWLSTGGEVHRAEMDEEFWRHVATAAAARSS